MNVQVRQPWEQETLIKNLQALEEFLLIKEGKDP